MRERSLARRQLPAGPRPEGGYRVRATLRRERVSLSVLLVDDQALVRGGFRMILEAEDDLEVVGEAGDGGEAVELAGAPQPDVVLMDVRMPEMDGSRRHAAARRRLGPKVLMLTTFDMDEYVYDALRAGASGFLLKDTPPEEIVAAIHAAVAADAPLAPR